MAHPHVFNPHAVNKGTLATGQAISVNKFNVQVERYLSQGGFAHVYLVRTATPVYNTTHHVLKRIAVPNEHMLTEVKKEVDIMRLLKGHPNIVHLIDAAWHRMPDGVYEVFILMEFCPGGGIIDMMNRRLRERLTEAEILQIFVDVCEGVAFMHNSRPPLLHRDLKVENILQASPTSFKLCDFGSATNVGKMPSTTQEIRALEADLNRHTTLQYRAPEMVDPYLRRPVDEKSDVWALGVLLYKLCYYTTPFEEHGPLAILNVQYKIPPYPVYSAQMNQLIASMLREHGVHRPSVFELLSVVHQMRGTKSQFHYNIPAPQPLSPAGRQMQFPDHLRPQVPIKPAETTISYRPGSQMLSQLSPPSPRLSPSKNMVAQPKEKVQEPAPMRRGRPTTNVKEDQSQGYNLNVQTSRSTPVDMQNFMHEEDRGWKAATQKSVSKDAGHSDNAWNVSQKSSQKVATSSAAGHQGFGDDFAENLWKSFDSDAQPKSGLGSTPAALKPPVMPPRTGALTGGLESPSYRPVVASRSKDAFAGLGIDSSRTDMPAPTLGEARRLRTGLAIMSSVSSTRSNSQRDISVPPETLLRPSPSPGLSMSRPQPISSSPGPPQSPAVSNSSWKSPSPIPSGSKLGQDSGSAESRFPSLEELDASFASPAGSALPGKHAASQPRLTSESYSSSQTKSLRTSPNMKPVDSLRHIPQPRASYNTEGTRSQQVTGTAMKDDRSKGRREEKFKDPDSSSTASSSSRLDNSMLMSRPALVRKHRSSVITKGSESSSKETLPPTLPSESHQRISTTTDWLTGNDDVDHTPSHFTTQPTAVVRQSPMKRTSYIERSNVPIHAAAAAAQQITLSDLKPGSAFTTISRILPKHPPPAKLETAPPEKDHTMLTENWSPVAMTHTSSKHADADSASSADEGPEDAASSIRGPPSSHSTHSDKARRKGRQGSVHDLVDLYGGGKAKDDPIKHDSEVTPKPPKRHSMLIQPSGTIPHSSSPQPIREAETSSRMMLDVNGIKRQQSQSSQPSHSPVPGKSRPQSVLVFPTTKSASEGLRISPVPSPSPGLSPPDQPPIRNAIRRTSITDMVHLYEVIGSKGKASDPRPTTSRIDYPLDVDKARVDVQDKRTGFSSLSQASDRPSGPPSPVRQRRNSRLDYGALSPSDNSSTLGTTDVSKSIFPLRKASTSVDDNISRTQPARSPSPERPYQGVGKLIDQWQKKANESAGVQRGGIPKRTVPTR